MEPRFRFSSPAASEFIHASALLSYSTGGTFQFDAVPEAVTGWWGSTTTVAAIPQGFVALRSSAPLQSSKTVFIASLSHPKLMLRRPLPITLERAGERVVAYSYDLEEIAIGDDEGLAIDEMRASIADLYYLLLAERDNLGPLPQKHWALLQRVVEEV